uniref:Uncharacterized protein n=1 Tax=Ditylum brightwellii TaxID=49249 RepID=A0A7S2EQE8_9STRA|mmetsp:Transcript_3987/g.6133  ORF Transcript_3987/g.6133 Transcript_3987/m.6133 type:complete len:552 (+) Transcript_3987:143-1798(+)
MSTTDKETGIILLLTSLICLGTWPALLRLCTNTTATKASTLQQQQQHENSARNDNNTKVEKHSYKSLPNDPWSTQQQENTTTSSSSRSCRRCLVSKIQQNRHPCHAYMDYTLAYVFFSSTIPFLLSSWTTTTTNTTTSTNIDTSSNHVNNNFPTTLIIISMIGGSLLSLGNITTQWSTTVYQAPLTTVLALQASMCVVLGTTLNYLLQPTKTTFVNRLVAGVVCFLVAIGLSVLAQLDYSRDKGRQQQQQLLLYELARGGGVFVIDDGGRADGDCCVTSALDYHSCQVNNHYNDTSGADNSLLEEQNNSSVSGTASVTTTTMTNSNSLIRQQMNISNSSDFDHYSSTMTTGTVGIWVAFLGGLCFGFFSPAFNIAVNDPFHWYCHSIKNSMDNDDDDGDDQGGGGGLSVPMANFYFSLSFAITSVIWNIILMKYPPPSFKQMATTTTTDITCQKSTVQEYIYSIPFQTRILALIAGIVCAMGNALQFQGGKLAGYATSDLVQAYPLVATMHDVFIFGEFYNASRFVFGCLVGMYVVYLMGVLFLIFSILSD